MSEGSYAFAVAPVIAWQPSSRMTLSLTSDYTQSRYRGNPFLPLYDGVFDLPVSNFYGEPVVPLSEGQSFSLHGILTYQVRADVRLREGLSFSANRQRDFNYDLDGLDSLGESVLRGYGESTDHTHDISSQTELLATVMSDGVRNRLVMGVELFTEVFNSIVSNAALLAPIALHHPVYGAVPADPAGTNQYWNPQRQLGVYVQDLVDLAPRVKVTIGARFDINRSEFTYQNAW